MLNVEVGRVSIIRQKEERVEIGLRGLGWEFQTVTIAEAKILGAALIAASEEVES